MKQNFINMRKTILLLIFAVSFISACKKSETPEPAKTNTVTIRDTVKVTNTVIQKDTVYCMLKSELVHGVWWAYKEGGIPVTPYKVEFFSNYYIIDGSSSGTGISYSSDYSIVYSGASAFFTVKVVNCTELSITNATTTASLRRQ